MLNYVVRSAAVAGVIIAAGLPLSAQANIMVTMTDTNSVTGLVATTSFTDLGTPGTATFAGGAFGNFASVTLSVNSNYDGSALPNSGLGIVNDSSLSALMSAVTGTDTLTISVVTSPFSIPSGNPLLLASGETSPFLSTGATASFFSALVSGVTTTTSTASITGAGLVLQTAGSPVVTAPNDAPPFTLENTLTITLAGGQGGNVNGTTAVSVPAPVIGAGLPGLIAACGGLIALGRRRRQKLA
jgi:hypothetical protein